MKRLVLLVSITMLAATNVAYAITVPLSIEKREEVCGNFQDYYTPKGNGQTYYVDPVNGSDSYSGSIDAPFETLKYAIEQVDSHDVIVLADGDYGDERLAASTTHGWDSIPVATGFTDWVTIIAAPGATPTFQSISIGAYRTPCPQDVPYDDQHSACQNNGEINAVRDRFFRELPETDLYLRFVGITVVNGVDIRGVRYVDIFHSTLQNIGDGQFRINVEDPSVFSSNTQFVTVGCNDITNTHIGIKITDRDYHLFANEIHDNTHDGISLNGGDRILIESNSIHNLDDGIGDFDFICYEDDTHTKYFNQIPPEKIDEIYVVEPHVELINGTNVYTLPEGKYSVNQAYKVKDDNDKDLPQDDPSYDHCNYLDSNNRCCTNIRTWNMHVDGMQQYMVSPNSVDTKWANNSENVTIRNNIFYHIESMGIMINGTHGESYKSWIFENNMFGPGGGYTVHLGEYFQDTFIFRHNSILYAPNDSWESPWREPEYAHMDSQNYYIKHWGMEEVEHYQVYNNILYQTNIINTKWGTIGYVANNIYIGDEDKDVYPSGSTVWRGEIEVSTPPYPEIPGSIQDYIDSGKLPGQITADSIAKDFGSTVNPLADDLLGRNRDKFPDVGALEYMPEVPRCLTGVLMLLLSDE